jgi:putative membrane protein
MTRIIAIALATLVALMHIWFLVLEMFLWETDIGRGTFNTTIEEAATAATLAMQQGLYNGFLAAGILYGLIARKTDFIVFSLLCIIVAGVFGGLTVSPSIIMVQALPAIIALGLIWISRPKTP